MARWVSSAEVIVELEADDAFGAAAVQAALERVGVPAALRELGKVTSLNFSTTALDEE